MDLTLRALHRHKITVGLILVEVALCFALTANGGALLAGKLSPMYSLALPPHADELYAIDPGETVTGATKEDEQGRIALVKADLAALAAIPGVAAAGEINAVPLGSQMETTSVSAIPRQAPDVTDVAIYRSTAGTLGALALELQAGRTLGPDDVTRYTSGKSATLGPSVLITKSLGARLFGDANPIGKGIYFGPGAGEKSTVVGVVSDVSKPIIDDLRESAYSIFVAVEPFPGGKYLVRSDRDDPARFAQSIERALAANMTGRTNIASQSLDAIGKDYFKSDRALAVLLVTVMIAVLAVCVIGISGITSYWIRQRHRSVGIRRALGATRGQILREFVLESVAISSLGVIAGAIAYVASSRVLQAEFGLPTLRLHDLALLGACFDLVCLAAVTKSIREAGRLPPVDAMRR
jgi:putative ABC transport system permease protein